MAMLRWFDTSAAVADRCVSVEMFEHMRNYDVLLGKIASWLRPGGQLFVHIFHHRNLMYPFETTGDDNWMARYFFTGGLMPSADTLPHFQRELRIEQRWRMFWMSCAELFGYDGGREWLVAHYHFSKP